MMRFLFGICLGAGLTLLLATTIDAPTSPVVEQLRSSWQRVLELTGNTLFRQQAPAARAEPRSDTLAESLTPEAETTPPLSGGLDLSLAREKLSERAAEELAQLAGTLAPEPLAERVPEEPAQGIPDAGLLPEQASRQAPEPALAPAGAAPATVASRQIENNRDAGPALSAEGTSSEQALFSPSSAGEPDVASVWVPFHSERSARGFARRLTAQLDHPFEVQREGAGAYSVVFSYADSAERDSLLSEVEEITGQ